MTTSRKIKIRGANWTIVFGRPPVNNCSAYCDPNMRKIWIRRTNRTRLQKQSCILHEILHASLYDLREATVEEVEEALMKGLELLD